MNTGEPDASTDTFRIEIFDGNTGAEGSYRRQYAPDVTQGYARVTRIGGSNPFVSYAVINDGGQTGRRTGDGAFIASSS